MHLGRPSSGYPVQEFAQSSLLMAPEMPRLGKHAVNYAKLFVLTVLARQPVSGSCRPASVLTGMKLRAARSISAITQPLEIYAHRPRRLLPAHAIERVGDPQHAVPHGHWSRPWPACAAPSGYDCAAPSGYDRVGWPMLSYPPPSNHRTKAITNRTLAESQRVTGIEPFEGRYQSWSLPSTDTSAPS